jgi:hypothetical protein
MPQSEDEKEEAERDKVDRDMTRYFQAYQDSVKNIADITPDDFFQEIEIVSDLFQWPSYITTRSDDEPAENTKSYKVQCLERIICALLIKKTLGHMSAALLKTCKKGSVREHYFALYHYFHPTSITGY